MKIIILRAEPSLISFSEMKSDERYPGENTVIYFFQPISGQYLLSQKIYLNSHAIYCFSRSALLWVKELYFYSIFMNPKIRQSQVFKLRMAISCRMSGKNAIKIRSIMASIFLQTPRSTYIIPKRIKSWTSFSLGTSAHS